METKGVTIRKFETENFKVVVEALEEDSPDLSFDDTGTVASDIARGKLILFCAHSYVVYKPTGALLGEDYLGNCIYSSLREFADHRECGRQNRKMAWRGVQGGCGSYFKDMIREAIKESRKQIAEFSSIRVRTSVVV